MLYSKVPRPAQRPRVDEVHGAAVTRRRASPATRVGASEGSLRLEVVPVRSVVQSVSARYLKGMVPGQCRLHGQQAAFPGGLQPNFVEKGDVTVSTLRLKLHRVLLVLLAVKRT